MNGEKSGILIFGPQPEKTGPEGGAGRGGDQNLGISIFLIKGVLWFWCDKVWCGVIRFGVVGLVKGMHFSQ